jgi:integrase
MDTATNTNARVTPWNKGMPHSLRRTKPTLILSADQNTPGGSAMLGHSKLESTVRYLGIEVDDALEIAEQTEV